ncbi:MAG: glycosyltransferase family 4 protein [Sedimenticola sp.]|nr:glycosyltransferase family 4 protein [Sedimenticola sp.]
MNILTFTTLYPNNMQTRHGVFIEERVRQLNLHDDISFTVVAPIPWFPFKISKLPKYSIYADVPSMEERSGITVHHPRYIVIPKIGMILAPLLLAASTYRAIRSIKLNEYQFDIIDAHYFYPDGVAAVIIGRLLNIPVMITARGSDINLLSKYFVPRKLIQWAARNADKLATVSKDLKSSLISLGVEESKINVFRNGVDLDKFRPMDRIKIRKRININNPTIISVGNLIELKGHHLVIEALIELPDFQLIIVGEGDMRGKLEKLASEYRVSDRVRFMGNVNQEVLVELYNASDILVLASSREGMANVLLEALACGTPVVATDVGGNREVINHMSAGVLVYKRNSNHIATGINEVFNRNVTRDDARKYAETLSWTEVTQSIRRSFANMIINRS